MTNSQSPNPEAFNLSIVATLHPTAESGIFGYTVEVLHSIHSLHRTNAIARQLNSNFSLQADILYEAIQHLLDAKPFSNQQLVRYFTIQQTMEEFHRTLEDSVQASLEVHLPYAVDFMLLGGSTTTYASLSVQSRVNLHQQYETLYWELIQKDRTVEQFISVAQKILTDI
ncbi:putative lipoic acid-binding regulatory protein [Flavobacterium arsenatis]|uniref:Lipoic acid-binding regulatory protein n=1 Tax=Flavobacterium arsenatis TaxID=1484332 RepID=A0ABU1TTT8_9FLAO|nr:hypothetical protein [Flavobacterium arsenatis]MDR6969299.1 putative lipoic acid-binding regulatory protein [Flavobacterium arsenatis]